MAGQAHLRLVKRRYDHPEIKDITGMDIRCDCFCALWRHTKSICWEHATIQVVYGNGAIYNSCKPCYDDMLIKEKTLD